MMHPALRARLSVQGAVFTSADAFACGYDQHSLARLVRSGEVIRVRRSAFVTAESLVDTVPEQRHLLRVQAILRSLGPDTTLVPSHQSALAIHALPIHGTDERHVHMTRTRAGNTRVTNGLSVHRHLQPAAFHTHDSLLVVHPAVAIVQTAAWYGLDAGMAAADQGLRMGIVTRADLLNGLGHARLGRGADLARATVERADGLAESVGESRTRVLFTALGLPTPELQVTLRDAAGPAGRVDFLFREQQTIAEFDGLVKYDGANGKRALADEKRREDRLRALGYEVVRLVWADLADPRRVWQLLQDAFARAARRR